MPSRKQRSPAWLKAETKSLVRAWADYDEAFLRDYLVADVEDPRLNVQSILTRHFLIEALFGNVFDELMDQEIRFAAVMNFLLQRFKQSSAVAEDFSAIHYALERQADNAEGIELPEYLSAIFSQLPATAAGMEIPNYFSRVLRETYFAHGPPGLSAAALNLFQDLWRKRFSRKRPRPLSVIEAAFGSANDYRYFESFGLARHLDYFGFDLAEKNIRNARAMFPQAHFEVGNVLELGWKLRKYDVAIAHDLFEHLSIAAMERAVGALCRVAQRALCFGFFHVHEGEEHLINPVEHYHCNTLSLSKLRRLLERHGFATQAISVEAFLNWKFGCPGTHNPHAYMILGWRKARSPGAA